ncbi:ACT domain-containing protein [Neisseriaceae bacterium TC5R-5]|nr:ACT domain-containing protein [Neisseriaceae bacterium TC5R-5]
MSGISDLNQLLASMEPQLASTPYVFCSLSEQQLAAYSDLQPLASFREREGMSLIVSQAEAQRCRIAFAAVFQAITLSVHSSLEAVGLTAAVASKLAEYQVSANVVAAYYHDHIFVPQAKATLAMQALRELQQQAREALA